MSADEKPTRVDDLAYYQHLRSRLDHEDSLIVNRLAWLMAAESFFFSAYAIALNGAGTPHHRRLLHLIPLVAMASSALIFVAIVAAVRALWWIHGLIKSRVPDPATLGLPPLHSPASMTLPGLAAPIILPPLFFTVWCYLLAAGGI
jgi:hypothetical protein